MSVADALAQWPFAVWLRTSLYAYPSIEALHIMGVALVVGTIIVVDTCILRRDQRLAILTPALLPWTLLGFMLAAGTGLLMFIARAGELVSNVVFISKIVLIFCAGTNAALLHSRGPINVASFVTRAQAAVSLMIWLAVIFAGRWIAYF